jgi:hemerythrin superfamily protein
MSQFDVVDLIKADHREVERLFDVLKRQPALRSLYFPVLCALLLAHSRAEETEVYPVAKTEAGETDEVAHSQDEHAEAEQMLEQMIEMDPDSTAFDHALDELIKAVTHHVEEEETRVLPGMVRQLSDQRRSQLGESFAASRAEHLGDRPGQATREELVQQARNADISGAASGTKDEIRSKLLSHAGQGDSEG